MNERAARTWAHRWAVEEHAHVAFSRLERALTAEGYPDVLVAEARAAAADERDHAHRCRELSLHFGGRDECPVIDEADELAPRSLQAGQRLLYEAVARCCIAETESAATLAELAGRTASPVIEITRLIARDEVRHARLGWSILGFARERQDLMFLSSHLPSMLATAGAPLFDRTREDGEDLPEHGVFSLATRRELFTNALELVIFPGLDDLGISSAFGCAWLEAQAARL